MRTMGKRLAGSGYSVLVVNPFYRAGKPTATGATPIQQMLVGLILIQCSLKDSEQPVRVSFHVGAMLSDDSIFWDIWISP